MIYTQNEYLAHHGVDKQKWGHRNGPPYPLKPTQMTESQKKANAHESWFKRKKREYEERKRKAAEEKELHKKGLLTEKDKKDIYDKADITEAYKHKSELSNKEISNLLNRYDMQQMLSQKVANLEYKEKQKGVEKIRTMQNFMNAVVGAGSAGINLYNMSAAVSNAFFGTDLKSIKWGNKDKDKKKDKDNKDNDNKDNKDNKNNKDNNKKSSNIISDLKSKVFNNKGAGENSQSWERRDDDDNYEKPKIGKIVETIKPNVSKSEMYKPQKEKKEKDSGYNSLSWLDKIEEKDYSNTAHKYVNFNTLADNIKRENSYDFSSFLKNNSKAPEKDYSHTYVNFNTLASNIKQENSYDFSSFLKKNNIGMSTVNDLTTSHKKEVDTGKDWLYNNDYDKVYEDYYDDDYYKR